MKDILHRLDELRDALRGVGRDAWAQEVNEAICEIVRLRSALEDARRRVPTPESNP